MFFDKMIKTLSHNLINIPGWYTKRKLVVIESDDWGAIRMPSMEAFYQFLKYRIRVDNVTFFIYLILCNN